MSKTKRDLSIPEITQLVDRAFGQEATISTLKQLTDGYFNNSYMINLSTGRTVVLKVAPRQDIDVLTYEKDLMRTEVLAMKSMFQQALPVPEVIFFDESQTLIDSHYFFMTFIAGIPLNKVKDQLSPAQVINLSHHIGLTMRPLLKTNYHVYGELGNEAKRFNTWYECFRSMIEDLMNDAQRINLLLPINTASALNIVEHHKEVLSEVTTATLVHKDLWDGNIFVTTDTYNLSGIIDTERSIYADPLMEVVCGMYQDNPSFIQGYLSKKTLSPSENKRILLYQFYLYLLMVIECPYREYTDQGQFRWASQQLQEILDQIHQAS